jgi:hypothetical protein
MAIKKCLASSRKILELVMLECEGICQQGSKVWQTQKLSYWHG